MSKNVEHHQATMLQATWIMKDVRTEWGAMHIMHSCAQTVSSCILFVRHKALCSVVLGIKPPKGKGSYTHEKKMELWNRSSTSAGCYQDEQTQVVRGSIRTDGVSARILFDDDLKTHQKSVNEMTKDQRLEIIPTRGFHN